MNVKVPKYVSEMQTYLAKTPANVLANYMIWRYIEASMDFLGEEALAIKLEYFNSGVLSGLECH